MTALSQNDVLKEVRNQVIGNQQTAFTMRSSVKQCDC